MPHVTSDKLKTLNQGLKAVFTKGVENTPNLIDELAMTSPSNHIGENYSWLKQLPVVKEFLTARQMQDTDMVEMYVENKFYESTVEIPYKDLKYDNIDKWMNIFASMGEDAALKPRELLFTALRNGTIANGIDGVPFFSDAHPAFDAAGAPATWDNKLVGLAGAQAWCLLDNSRSFMRPIVYQLAEKPRVDIAGGFFDDRGNFIGMSVPFGSWAAFNVALVMPHLALASSEVLDANGLYNAMEKMQTVRKSNGMYANINPTHLIVAPSQRRAAEEVVNAAFGTGGSSNTLYQAVKVVVAPELTGWTL